MISVNVNARNTSVIIPQTPTIIWNLKKKTMKYTLLILNRLKTVLMSVMIKWKLYSYIKENLAELTACSMMI